MPSNVRPERLRARATVAVRAIASMLALTAAALVAAQAVPATGLLVHGSGTVYGEPDRAVVTLGVDVAAPQVQQALGNADARMRQVRQALLDGGIGPQAIRTVAFNVWREDIRGPGGAVTGERFHVVHSYQITVSDLAGIGDLLAAAVAAGANDVQGIVFTIADPTALQAAARSQAMRDAKARAEQLAQLAGVALGRPVSIEETSTPLRTVAPAMASARLAGGGAPVEGGQLAVQVAVTVRYAIQ